MIRRALGPLALALVLIGAIIAAWSRFVAPFRTRITHAMIQLPRSHKHLDGTTIAFVSDTHVGPNFPASALDTTTQILRRAQPDIVLFGGDYISESPRYLKDVREPLAAMAATARLGAWGVMGNHDIANIRRRVIEELAETGISFMSNEARKIETGKGSFWLVGIDEILLGHADLDKAFAGVPADALVVALWHNADRAEKLEPYGPLLMLSGHSHGGQIRLPGIGALAAPKLGKRYSSGRYEIGDMTLFVSNGIGVYRPPVRYNCPPEVVLARLIA